MRYFLTLSMAVVLAAAAVGFGWSGRGAARAQAARPDISGTWFSQGGSLRPPPGQGDIPLTPWALERMKAERPNNEDFRETTDPSLKYADPNGYPRISMHPMKFKLVQTEDYIYQLWEYNQNWRQITMNKPHLEPALIREAWYGNAVGKWDGETLVVDSIGYIGSTWLDSVAHPHTEDLHIVERIHRDGETLVFDFTFDDPKAYTKPWSAQLTYKLVHDGTMIEEIYTMSNELRFRERFRQLQQAPPIPIRR
jgi:hypothetical protein